MGYRHKGGKRNERKKGIDAVNGTAMTDAQMLAIATLNKQNFEMLDDLGDADFCKAMEDIEDKDPDTYTAFWWWRIAHEKAAKDNTEFNDSEPKFRCFEVMQYLALPWDEKSWKKNRCELRKGVVPLITQEQIELALAHRSIKRWCWVLHDRDVYTAENEVTDKLQRAKAGTRKWAHYHCWIEVSPAQSISTIARWFQVPPNFVEVKSGRGAFLDCAEYAVHESPKAVEEGKTHYDDDEVHCSPGFDFRKEVSRHQTNRAKYGKRAGDMKPADVMRMHVLHDGWNMRQCRDDDPITYSQIRASLPPLRLDYLLDAAPAPFRLNIYIDGGSGLGKTSLSTYLAEAMFPAYEYPYFTIGGDERVTFDGYDGEPVIIWDDMRAVDFITRFHSNGTYKIFNPQPKKDAQQAKHSRVILCNSVNIVNGIQPYEEFIAGLAGTYIDRDGNLHESEDETQAWRRFPLFLCVKPDMIDILLNNGALDPDTFTAKQIEMTARVHGSLKSALSQLDGRNLTDVIGRMTAPIVDEAHRIVAAHADKISDPDQIPDEFANYGMVQTAAEVAAEEEAAMLARWEAEAEQFAEYAVWLQQDFVLADAAEKAGMGTMPDGWRQSAPPTYMYDKGDVTEDAKRNMPPLTFEQWRELRTV